MQYKVELTIEKDGDGFHAFCPVLPGLHVGGDTKDEVLEYAKDAVIAYLQSMIKHGEALPIAYTTHNDRNITFSAAVIEFAMT